MQNLSSSCFWELQWEAYEHHAPNAIPLMQPIPPKVVMWRRVWTEPEELGVRVRAHSKLRMEPATKVC